MGAIVINKDNYKREVLDSDKTVLLDFWADWCGPCRTLSIIMDRISDEYPQIKVGKVDISIEEELSRAFGIKNVPSLFVIKNGSVVRSSVGAHTKADILKLLQ